MAAAEPPAIEDPALPADPTAYRRGRPARRFWVLIAVVVAWTLACVIAGGLFVSMAPRLYPPVEASLPFTRPAPAAQPAPPPTPAPAPMLSELTPEEGLSARLTRLEDAQRRTSQAAAAVLAAAALADAARGPTPFSDEVAAVSRFLPASTDVRALQRAAQSGAPTRTALAAEFSRVAARTAVAARTPPQDASLFQRASHALASVMTIRRVDRTVGDDADAVIARAELLIEEGDLEGGMAELERLSPAGRNALSGWRAKAARRLEIDQLVSQIRAAALADLTRNAQAGS